MVRQSVFISLFAIFFCACWGQPKETIESRKSPQNSVAVQQNDIPLSSSGFYCGLLDSKGDLWFGTRGDGVFRYNNKGFTHYTTEHGLIHNDISCVAEDRKGNLWFGTPIGACKFDGKEFSQLQIPQSDTSSVWLDEVYPVVNPNQVSSILEDSRGDLWLGTNGAGVYRYSGGSFTQHLRDVGMFYVDDQQHNIVLSMTEDLEGNIWFSSLSHGGVSRYDGQTFTHYVEELSDDFVRVVYPDSKGNIWIGTHGNLQGGLDRFDGKKFEAFFKTDAGFEHNNVRWIYEDTSGLLWLGSGTTELTTFDGTTFRSFRDQHGHKFHRILFVIGDADGDIWFGNADGLWRYDHQNVHRMDLVSGSELITPVPNDSTVIPSDAQLIFHEPNREFWFANDTFLYRATSLRVQRFDLEESLPSDRILGVQSGGDGRIFFDTPNGVGTFDGSSFEALPIDTLSALEEIDRINAELLWFRCGWEYPGPLLFNGRNLQVVPFPTSPLEKEFRKNYPRAGFNPYAIFCQYKAQNGSIWFGTSDMGIYRFADGKFSWMHEQTLNTTPEGGTFGIRSMTEDQKGYFWINQLKDIYKIGAKIEERPDVDRLSYQRFEGIPDEDQNYFMYMSTDTFGHVWMLDSGKLWRWDGTEFSEEIILEDENPVTPTSMYRDALGTIWISTKEQGVFQFIGDQAEKWRRWNH